MGQGGCWSLCSGVNSCTPLQGLITQVSLEILAAETPGGRGVLGKELTCSVRHASTVLLRKSSSSRTFLLERIYFTSLSKMSHSIFSSCKRLIKAVVFTQGQLMLQTCCCLQRYKGDSFMNFHVGAYCFHQLLPYFLVSTIFSLNDLNNSGTSFFFFYLFLYIKSQPHLLLCQYSDWICKIYSCLKSCLSFLKSKISWNGNFLHLQAVSEWVSETHGSSPSIHAEYLYSSKYIKVRQIA